MLNTLTARSTAAQIEASVVGQGERIAANNATASLPAIAEEGGSCTLNGVRTRLSRLHSSLPRCASGTRDHCPFHSPRPAV